MHFHVAFDQESDFEVSQEVTQKFISRIVKQAAVNFLKNPETLAELATGRSVLTLLIENPNDDIEEALERSTRFRLYDVEQLLETEEEIDAVDYEIATRYRAYLELSLGSDDEQFSENSFAVYAIIINSTFDEMAENVESNEKDSTAEVVLEQVIFFKPKDFILNLLGCTVKVVEDNLENFLNNIPNETVTSNIDNLIESKGTAEASV